MPGFRKASLIVNCGYARVAIYENSNPSRTGRHARHDIDFQNRAETFKTQFSTHCTYGISDDYFTPTGKDHRSPFDRDSTKILDGFSSKFRDEIGYSRESYLQNFSVQKWSALPSSEKTQHTLSNCKKCYEKHENYQLLFPLKPVYKPKAVISIDKNALHRQGVKEFTSNFFAELNNIYTSEAGSSFAEALVSDKSLKLEHKKTRAEKRREKRQMQKKITEKINQSFAENATITMLSEGESKSMYHRKRMRQSYYTPEAPPTKKKPTHQTSVKCHGILKGCTQLC